MSFYAVVSAESGQWSLTITQTPGPSLTPLYGPMAVVWVHEESAPDREAVDRWLPEGWSTTGGDVSTEYRCVFPIART